MKRILFLVLVLISAAMSAQISLTTEGYTRTGKKPQASSMINTDSVLFVTNDGILRSIPLFDFKGLMPSGAGGGTTVPWDSITGKPANLDLDGTDDVTGSVSATDNAIARFDGITGKIIQNSGVIIDDVSNVSNVTNLSAESATISNTISAGQFTGGYIKALRLSPPADKGLIYVDDATGLLGWHNGTGFSYIETDGGTDDQTAAEVPNTPSGNLAATNSQAAHDELQGDIDALNTAISNAPSGDFLADGTIPMTGSLDMGGNHISSVLSITAGFLSSVNAPIILSWGASFNNQKLTNLADPTLAQDAATKAYVDANSGGTGLTTEQSERLASLDITKFITISTPTLTATDTLFTTRGTTDRQGKLENVLTGSTELTFDATVTETNVKAIFSKEGAGTATLLTGTGFDFEGTGYVSGTPTKLTTGKKIELTANESAIIWKYSSGNYGIKTNGEIVDAYLSAPQSDNANPELVTGTAIAFGSDNANALPTGAADSASNIIRTGQTGIASIVANTDNGYGSPYVVKAIGAVSSPSTTNRIIYEVDLENSTVYEYSILARTSNGQDAEFSFYNGTGIVNATSFTSTSWTLYEGTFTSGSSVVNGSILFYPIKTTANSTDYVELLISLKAQ